MFELLKAAGAPIPDFSRLQVRELSLSCKLLASLWSSVFSSLLLRVWVFLSVEGGIHCTCMYVYA